MTELLTIFGALALVKFSWILGYQMGWRHGAKGLVTMGDILKNKGA